MFASAKLMPMTVWGGGPDHHNVIITNTSSLTVTYDNITTIEDGEDLNLNFTWSSNFNDFLGISISFDGITYYEYLYTTSQGTQTISIHDVDRDLWIKFYSDWSTKYATVQVKIEGHGSIFPCYPEDDVNLRFFQNSTNDVLIIPTPEEGYEIDSFQYSVGSSSAQWNDVAGDYYIFENIHGANNFIKVTFKEIEHTVSIGCDGGGSVISEGVTYGDGESLVVGQGQDVSFEFIPDFGQNLVSVTVDGTLVSASESYTLENISSDHQISVVFSKLPTSISLGEDFEIIKGSPKQLVAAVSPSYAEGEISWNSSDTSVATVSDSGLVFAVSGGTATITATIGGVSDSCEVTVRSYHSIIINGSQNGTVSLSSTYALADETITLTVHPNDGYFLHSIDVDPKLNLIPTENGYTFVMPDEDVVVTPTFVPTAHTVTFHNEGVSWEVPFSHGAPLEFPEDPSKESDPQWDYRFAGWVDSDKNVVYEGTEVTDDMHLYAKYVKMERLYDIDFVVNGIVFKHFDLAYDDVIIPPADPYIEGYDFVGWRGYTPGMTVVNDMEFHAVFVESSESIPPWQGDDDPPYIPPNIVVEKSGNDYLWIFVVLGSVATFLFLLFAYFERRDREE